MSNFVPEKTALGIEFGSTRIKAVLIGPEHTCPPLSGLIGTLFVPNQRRIFYHESEQ